jgi:hypothetical protein
MRKSQLLICFVITALVMVFTIDVAKAFSARHANVETSTLKLVFDASSTELPITNDSNDQNGSEIKAASSFSSLPSALHIHTDQDLVCLFEIQYEVNRFNSYQPPIPVALTRLFLVLFEVIVSPNAP